MFIIGRFTLKKSVGNTKVNHLLGMKKVVDLNGN